MWTALPSFSVQRSQFGCEPNWHCNAARTYRISLRPTKADILTFCHKWKGKPKANVLGPNRLSSNNLSITYSSPWFAPYSPWLPVGQAPGKHLRLLVSGYRAECLHDRSPVTSSNRVDAQDNHCYSRIVNKEHSSDQNQTSDIADAVLGYLVSIPYGCWASRSRSRSWTSFELIDQHSNFQDLDCWLTKNLAPSRCSEFLLSKTTRSSGCILSLTKGLSADSASKWTQTTAWLSWEYTEAVQTSATDPKPRSFLMICRDTSEVPSHLPCSLLNHHSVATTVASQKQFPPGVGGGFHSCKLAYRDFLCIFWQ